MSVKEDILNAYRQELEFAELLKVLYPENQVLVTVGYDTTFDVKCGSWTYELKTDYLFEKTGNVAIEYRYKGNPSGLFSSVANYFVIEIPKSYIVIERKLFIEWLREHHQELKKVYGGDNNQSQLILIKPSQIPISGKNGLITQIIQK
jgi:hypothetical protein